MVLTQQLFISGGKLPPAAQAIARRGNGAAFRNTLAALSHAGQLFSALDGDVSKQLTAATRPQCQLSWWPERLERGTARNCWRWRYQAVQQTFPEHRWKIPRRAAAAAAGVKREYGA